MHALLGRASPVVALGAGLVVLAAQVPLRAQPPPSAARIMPGDLIVKFRDASEPGRQLAAVLAGQRTVASMAPLAARLSREIGVPLVLAQVTSGREALLALDREALGRSLLARAGREAAVQKAVMSVPTGSVLPGAELVLRIEVRPKTTAAAREALPARLALGTLARPRAEADSSGSGAGGDAWRLHYDVDALTLALIAAMQQRPEVEYAQANRILRPVGPGEAAPRPAAGASR